MKLWLDDQIHDPDAPQRWTPEGWKGVSCARDAMKHVESGLLTAIDLDNDLGEAGYPDALEGLDVINLIEELAHDGKIPRMEIFIHTSNSEARRRMELIRERCYQYWDAQDEGRA